GGADGARSRRDGGGNRLRGGADVPQGSREAGRRGHLLADPVRRMMTRVRALAKINLDLRVLGKRPDGFHELRTIFQTISLADTLEIAFTPARKTAIELTDALNIADNLVVRAARMVMDSLRAPDRIDLRLTHLIP